MLSDKELSNKIIKLESKLKEAERFIVKYNSRNMNDLEEYYKGVKWALDFALYTLQNSEDV